MSIDFTKLKSFSIGGINLVSLAINGLQVWKTGIKNWVRFSTESDGVSIYNGGLGYKNVCRVRSGGEEISETWGVCTGFIPVRAGDVIRISGVPFSATYNGNAINVSNANFTNIGQFTMLKVSYGIFQSAYSDYSYASVVQESSNVWKWIVPPADSGVAYIRVSGYTVHVSPKGENLIVTINEEIV